MAISMPWPSSPSKYFLSSFMLVNLRPVCAAPRQPIMWGMGVTLVAGGIDRHEEGGQALVALLLGSVTAMT